MDLTILFVTTFIIHSNLFFTLDTSNPSIIPNQVWGLYYSSMHLKTPAFEEAKNFKEFNPYLINSWKSAKKAQEISSELKDSVLSYYVYLFSPKEFNKFLPFYNKFNQAEAEYRASINNASIVFSMLRNRFASDMQLLDLVGVDKSNSTSRAHFEEGRRVLKAFEGEITPSCSSLLLPAKTACALKMMKKKKTASDFYSAVVSADDNSLIVLFTNFHLKTQEIVKKMNEQYIEENKQTEKLLKNVSLLLKWFDKQQAYLITSKHENEFSGQLKQKILLGKPGSFSTLSYEVRRAIEEQSNKLIEAQKTFEIKADDYLLNSVVKTNEVKASLKDMKRQLDRMKNKLITIAANARQKAFLERQKAKESYFTSKADYLMSKAESFPLGLSVVYYAKAIDYLNAVSTEQTLKNITSKAGKIISQLKKLGVNVETEESVLKELEKPTPSSVEELIAKADLLLTQVEMKAIPFKEAVSEKRNKIRNLFSIVKELSKLSFFKQPSNDFEQKFEASLADDDFETLYSDITLYNKIEEGLEGIINPFLSDIMNDKVEQRLILAQAKCDEEAEAVDKVIVVNPFNVVLKNLTISIKPFGKADLQVRGKVFFGIKKLEPRSRKEFLLNITLTPVHCYAQQNHNTGGMITSTRRIEVLYPVQNVMVPFEKPFESAEVMKASHYFIENENKVILKLPSVNTTAFVVFANSSESRPIANVTINTGELQEQASEKKIYYNPWALDNEKNNETTKRGNNTKEAITAEMIGVPLRTPGSNTSEKKMLVDAYNYSVSAIREKARQELEFAKEHYSSEEMLSKAVDSFKKGEYFNSIYYSRKAVEGKKNNIGYVLLFFFISVSFIIFFMLKKPKAKKQPRRVMSYHFSR